MTLGSYVDYKGAKHRVVRICDQKLLVRIPEREAFYVMTERLYELKSVRTGRLEFISECADLSSYTGEQLPNDATGFALASKLLGLDKEVSTPS